jgi:hypothetical protein
LLIVSYSRIGRPVLGALALFSSRGIC